MCHNNDNCHIKLWRGLLFVQSYPPRLRSTPAWLYTVLICVWPAMFSFHHKQSDNTPWQWGPASHHYLHFPPQCPVWVWGSVTELKTIWEVSVSERWETTFSLKCSVLTNNNWAHSEETSDHKAIFTLPNLIIRNLIIIISVFVKNIKVSGVNCANTKNILNDNDMMIEVIPGKSSTDA